MNKKKLSFAIENIRLSEDSVDKSNFALLDVDAFATGKSLHNTYVTEETLKNTARTILLKPLVFAIDKMFNDLGSHDSSEVVGGFVPHNSPIEFKTLEDGRIMLSCQVLVWRKYCGKLLEYFERDGNRKSISVEIEVYDEKTRDDGLTELLDYSYQALTALGESVRAAIPNAQAILQFSKEYEKDFALEFGKYDSIDMTIPERMKSAANEALELYKAHGKGGTSVSLAIARHIIANEKISPEKVRQIAKRRPKLDNLNDKTTGEYISNGLYGSAEFYEWSKNIVAKMDDIDNRNISYFGNLMTFPYKSMKDVNPALKGIDPPVSLAQANEIARQADAIGTDESKNGWAIAISSFKKTHTVKDGHWVKKESSTENNSMEEFALEKEDWGTGESIEVNKSKESVSEKPWGNVDKSALMWAVLKAKNYKSLIKDVYMKVEDGWQDSPSSHLKYPVMQISEGKVVYNRYGLSSALAYAKKEGEDAVVSKINGIYEKLDLADNENEKKKEEMAVNDDEKEKVEAKEEEKFEENQEVKEEEKEKEEEKQEGEDKEEKKEEKDMSLDSNLDLAAILAFLEDETETYRQVVEEEFAKEEPARNYAKMFTVMCQKMCKMGNSFAELKGKHEEMCNKFAKLEEESKAYMAENEELKKFKANIETQQFAFEVDSTIGEIVSAVEIPQDEVDSLREQAKNFSLENIDAWKNLCKARAFSFATKSKKKDKNEEEVVRYALPWAGKKNDNKNDSIWNDPIFKK